LHEWDKVRTDLLTITGSDTPFPSRQAAHA
jgi:hypothetical protein